MNSGPEALDYREWAFRCGTAYSPASNVKWRFGGGYKDDQSGEWPVTVMGARGLYPGYWRFDRADETLVDKGVGGGAELESVFVCEE